MTAGRSCVVLVDEDMIQMAPFVAELGLRGTKVRVFAEADSCLRSARRCKGVAVFVVDVMLPSDGRYSREDTRDYLYTGVFLARDIRNAHPKTPILLVSNHALRENLRRIERAMATIGCCAFIAKQSFANPGEFADLVQRIAERGVIGAKPRNIFGRLARGIMLQPNVAGVGIDIKELLRS